MREMHYRAVNSCICAWPWGVNGPAVMVRELPDPDRAWVLVNRVRLRMPVRWARRYMPTPTIGLSTGRLYVETSESENGTST